jgi:hypothetical protein
VIAKNTDLRHINTGVRLTSQERRDAEFSHMLAANDAKHRAMVADLARRDIKPRVAIGSGYVPNRVARAFAYVAVGGLR